MGFRTQVRSKKREGIVLNFDFSKIRSYQGSQNSGFEELMCQLAHLQAPQNAVSFIRKEGAGGDAGVECFCILEGDEEHAWQAKYFIGEMSSSRWAQLDKSFCTALEKHPHLTKYIVSMPLDRTDSRKVGRGGKKVVSILDEWNSRVEKWTAIAEKNGREIEFEYWGKHEIVSYLTIDDPLYTGRALYWFNEPVIRSELLASIASDSRDSLGERYTPKFHVELPVTRKFDGLSLNSDWWERLNTELSELRDQRDKFLKSFNEETPNFLNAEMLTVFNEACQELVSIVQHSISGRCFLDVIDQVKNTCNTAKEFEEKFSAEAGDALYDDANRKLARTFNSFFYSLGNFSSYLHSDPVAAAESRVALLSGEAGIGKSHLLCDLSLVRVKQGLPTLFLLGQHYRGGNPLELISDALDLSNQQNQVVLGALDAVGEACRTQTLIVIDAINEGYHRDDWFNHIQHFLTKISRFKNISVLLSCRTTYVQHLIPQTTLEKSLVGFVHYGFQGYEHRAAAKYLSKQGIVKPSAPILAPEFTNPLFLKTCCTALRSKRYDHLFPRGCRDFPDYLTSM